MKDKFNLTKEENIFLAKKLEVFNIYSGARLEGCNVTFPQTQTILDGVNVSSVKLNDITCILNLRDAWKYVLENISDEFNLDYICKINFYVSRNESLSWGTLRNGKVGISGTDYIPNIPDIEKVSESLMEIQKIECVTTRAIKYMLYGMRNQLFWDGNKRTSIIASNKIMIENGKGIISVRDNNIEDFNRLLTEYYDSNDDTEIFKFIYENCIHGLIIEDKGE